MALPLPVIAPQPDAYHMAPHRIKRCTFRRFIDVEVSAERVYDVECLFPDRKFRHSAGRPQIGYAVLQLLHRAPHLPSRRRLGNPLQAGQVASSSTTACSNAMTA